MVRSVRMLGDYQVIKDKLAELVNISWLSVHRENNQNDEYERVHERTHNYVDEKLNDLMRKLTIYQLQLESEASKIADKFKEDIFSLMLYDEDVDKVNIQSFEHFNPDEIKNELLRAYDLLGINVKDKNKRIIKHTDKLQNVINIIKEGKMLDVEDIFSLSLINRTLSLISISKENEEKKQQIFNPISVYLKLLKDFMPEKEFKLDKDSSGELEIYLKNKKSKGKKIPLFSLSSGEKQLIILFTETLLQKNEPYLFITDEPELSLHIDWQRRIIETLRKLNTNAQITVATHSPEIAGKWKQSVTNMENITNYDE
jgi:predicted ATP-binding protein involved in virulence